MSPDPAARTELAEDVTARTAERCVTLLNRADVPEHVRCLSSPQLLEVEVADDGRGTSSDPARQPGPEPSHGMIGMRERAALYGGSVEFGPRPDGGFGVRARLPMGQESS